MRNRAIILLVVAAVCAGCNSKQERPNAVKQQYGASTVKVYLPLAQDQFARGEYASAAESAKKVVEAAPQLGQGHTIYGKALLASDKKVEAEAQFKAAVDIDPSASEPWFGLAVAADNAKDRPAAIRYLETAVACPDAGAEVVTYLADAYMAAGENDKALALLEDKCRKMGGDPVVMKAAAAANLRLGHSDRAAVLYEGLCQANPKDKSAMEMLAYAYMDAGRLTDAAEVYEKLCEKSPAAATHAYVLKAAGCYISDGKYDKAVAVCDRYASTCKDDAAFWMVMGRAALGKRDASRSLYAAKRAMAIDPSGNDARILMGCAQYTDGRYADAIDTFGLLRGQPSSFVCMMKGRCYDRLGDKNAAMAAYQQALKLDPENRTVAQHIKDIANGATLSNDMTTGNGTGR
jgi:Flp pilus assembly protein TadD